LPAAPFISAFSVIAGSSSVWIAEGMVQHAMPTTVTVVFGGLFEGNSTNVNVDGSFSFAMILAPGTTGTVTAQAFDQDLQASNIVFDYVT
jgi:hypothetical protein